jgi:uncharacterized protein YraI
LSDVVLASSFEELDAALDGCTINLSTIDDVSLNVRLGPSMDAPQIGFVSADSIVNALGTSQSGAWYRFTYEDAFAWVLSSSAQVSDTCAGLRVFPDNHSEDPSSYNPASNNPEPEGTEAP